MDSEGRIERYLAGTVAQQTRTYPVKGTRPGHASLIVPAASPMTFAEIRSTRRLISEAARREKVSMRMRRGSAPPTIR